MRKYNMVQELVDGGTFLLNCPWAVSYTHLGRDKIIKDGIMELNQDTIKKLRGLILFTVIVVVAGINYTRLLLSLIHI